MYARIVLDARECKVYISFDDVSDSLCRVVDTPLDCYICQDKPISRKLARDSIDHSCYQETRHIHSDNSAWHNGSRTLNISYGLGIPTLRDSGKDQLPVRQLGANLTFMDVLSLYRFLDVPKITTANIFNARAPIGGFQCTKLGQ